MGLSLKQVSMEEFDWSKALIQAQKLELPKVQKSQNQNQNQIQQNIEQLKCPRCDSTNTKFCYYNNYNKSQPRHFCRACKRHWTNGGTLRNIPVGGCRKNKRLKKTTKSAAVSAAASTSDGRQNLPLFQSLFPPTEFENFTINYGIINSQKICNQSDQDELIHVETEETWQYPGTADMSESYWSWDDIQTFAATDLNIAWDHHDGHDIKP